MTSTGTTGAMTAPLSINARVLRAAVGPAVALVTSTEPGLLAGGPEALAQLPEGLAERVELLVADGSLLAPGQSIARAVGSGIDLNRVEDHLLGVLGFASGVATRARALVTQAPPGLRVVCGASKKLPAAMKPALRAGLDAAGVGHRCCSRSSCKWKRRARRGRRDRRA